MKTVLILPLRIKTSISPSIMPIKYTYDIVLQTFQDKGCILHTPREEYKSIKTPLNFTCKCGKDAKTTFSSFKNPNVMCRSCGVKNSSRDYNPPQKYTYDTVLQTFQDKGCVLHTPREEYKSLKTPLNFTCKCGKEAKTIFANFRKPDTLCRSCGARNSRNSSSRTCTTIDDVKNAFKERGCILLSTQYQNTKIPLDFVCSCGEISKITYQNFKLGYKCSNCTGRDAASTIQKTPWKEVQNLFILKNLTLLSPEEDHKNKNSKLRYRCLCGTEATITFNNAKVDTWKGCAECSRNTSRNNAASIKAHFDEESCELLTPLNEYKSITQPLSYQCSCGAISTITYKAFRNGQRCRECMGERRKMTTLKLYGVENVSQSPEIQAKIRRIVKERYGVSHSMQLKRCVKLAQETNLSKYGYKYKFCTPEIKEKGRDVLQDRLGVRFLLQSPEIQEKITKKFMMNYGVSRPLLSSKIHEKIKKTRQRLYGSNYFGHSSQMKDKMKERYGAEYYVQSNDCKDKMKERYGAEYYILSKHYKSLMLSRYGVKHPMQSAEILSRAIASGYKSKDYCFSSGRIERVQGYEPYCLSFLLREENIQEDDIVVGSLNVPKIPYMNPYTSRKSYYFPDIFIPSLNLLIEVKSPYTYHLEVEKNEAKFQACLEANYRIQLYMFAKCTKARKDPLVTCYELRSFKTN